VVATSPVVPTVSRFEIVSTLEVLARWANSLSASTGVDMQDDQAIVLLHETLERVRRYDFDEVADMRDQLGRVKTKHARATKMISDLLAPRAVWGPERG